MRIGIDAHAIGTQAGGNETYMWELLKALEEHAPVTDIVAFADPHGSDELAASIRFPVRRLASGSSYLRVPILLPRMARRERVDLLHVQYNAPPYCPCPFVASIHDVVWLRHPELLKPSMRHRLKWLVPGTLRRAARVFTLTEAVKGEIIEAYGVPAGRIDVVPPAIDPALSPERNPDVQATAREKYGLPQDFVLYVGALQPRKNLVRLATAFSRLGARGLPHALVLAGKRAWLTGDMLADIEALGLGDRLRYTGYVDRDDLPALFGGASAFAYVSVYEGFGLPVLEALACGAPTLAADIPVFREVAGDAALLVDPLEVDAIEDGLAKLLTDNDLRGTLQASGPTRAAHFSRERTAKAALRGYGAALE
jgi:glycosyltransferase involved in cell wall biosynthesis